MENKVCCAFGHRLVFSPIGDALRQILVRLVCEENVTTFLIGDQGEFDALFTKSESPYELF